MNIIIRRHLSTFLSLILLTFFTVGCQESHYLDNTDRGLLFAYPTTHELNTIRQEWKSRDLSGTGYRVEKVETLDGSGAMLKIISYTTQGMKQYAALLLPSSQTKVSLRIYVNGFDLNNTTNSIKLTVDEKFNEHPFAFALPSLRGQSLSIELNGVVYATPVAEGKHCEAFDGGADDVIALINVVEQTEGNVDIERASVRGGSRGGTVALLAAERDPRIKAAINVAGPTNMLELTSQNEDDATYQCQFLSDLVEHSKTFEQTRKTMLASSPLFFAETLPVTQVHLAEDDLIVPVSQGYDLKTVMTELRHEDRFSLFVYSDRNHSTIIAHNPELAERIEALLSQL